MQMAEHTGTYHRESDTLTAFIRQQCTNTRLPSYLPLYLHVYMHAYNIHRYLYTNIHTDHRHDQHMWEAALLGYA